MNQNITEPNAQPVRNEDFYQFGMIDAAFQAIVDKRQPLTILCINKQYVQLYTTIYIIYIDRYRIRY